MEEHITLPPEQRTPASLDGVPSVYYHQKCGKCTGMPVEIIRSYLVNPFLYNSYTFCCGCGTYIHQRELTWVETGESLDDYFNRLKKEHRNVK